MTEGAAAVKNEDPPSPEKTPFSGSCRNELKSAGMLRWGPGRRTRFFRRQREMQVQPFSCFLEKEEPDLDLEGEGDDDKRAVESPNVASSTKVCRKRKEARLDSKDRWSKERYSSAELKLMDIMEDKGAVLGKPILRPELRAEARKHIGDTGLLDHLLKHMAGKVVPEKNVRFQRRHNSEGAMEYWLEPADFMDLRKQAGAPDPYWCPPPGWNPNDCPFQDSACAKERKKLEEKIAIIMKFLERIFGKIPESEEVSIQPAPTAPADKERLLGSGCGALPEMYSDLLKQKCVAEANLREICNLMERIQEEIRKASEEERAKKKDETEKRAPSGFRKCKPEGTFLWPRNGLNAMSQLQAEDFLTVRTPPSASSSSAPALPWVMHRPSSPVEPQTKPKIVPVAQADNCRRKVLSVISASASLSSADLLLPVLYHSPLEPGESGLRPDTASYNTGSTITSANPPHPDVTARVVSSGSWLSL